MTTDTLTTRIGDLPLWSFFQFLGSDSVYQIVHVHIDKRLIANAVCKHGLEPDHQNDIDPDTPVIPLSKAEIERHKSHPGWYLTKVES